MATDHDGGGASRTGSNHAALARDRRPAPAPPLLKPRGVLSAHPSYVPQDFSMSYWMPIKLDSISIRQIEMQKALPTDLQISAAPVARAVSEDPPALSK